MRNNLAHCVEGEDDGKPILKTRSGVISYTEDEIVTIRKNIRFYNELFEQIVDLLG